MKLVTSKPEIAKCVEIVENDILVFETNAELSKKDTKDVSR